MLTTLASPTDLSTPVPQSPTPPVFVSASPMSSEPSLIRKVSLESGLQNFKLQPAATESGSAVFKVDYFRHPTSVQPPQLAKWMAVAAGVERVYEIGPVFS